MNNDVFYEQLVKKKPNVKDNIKKSGIIAGTVVILVLVNYIPYVSLVLMLLTLWGAYFLYGRTNIEYEYILTNGDLDIDIIYNRSKRKRLMTIKPRDFQKFVKFNENKNSSELNKFDKFYDLSSGNISDDTYVIITDLNGKRTKILIEPNERLYSGIKRFVPITSR